MECTITHFPLEMVPAHRLQINDRYLRQSDIFRIKLFPCRYELYKSICYAILSVVRINI